MLKIEKASAFSGEYRLLQENREVGTLKRSFWKHQATCELEGGSLQMEKHGFWVGHYRLLDGEREILRAESPNAFSSRLLFDFDGASYEMRPKSWWNGNFKVEKGGEEIGTIEKSGIMTRSAEIELPTSLPLMLQVFLGWIALRRWEDADASSSSP